MSDLLHEGLLQLTQNDADIEALLSDENTIRLLYAYINEIELFNAAYGLVGAMQRDEIIIKHILDSLAPLGIMRRAMLNRNAAWRMADVGSGAGLPGIPLALAMPLAHITLVERMGRRCGFLRNVQAVLSICNIEIEEMDMKKMQPALFDLVCFRAFSPIENEVLKNLLRLLKPNGMIAAYKGRIEKIQTEMSLLTEESIVWEAIPYHVPFLDEARHLVLITPPF